MDSKYLNFIRPRRFGKSLFLSTLSHYYDLNNKEDFEDLFRNLYIADKPTGLKTSYIILKLNFSGLNTDSKEVLHSSFRETVRQSIIFCINKYKNIFDNHKDITNKIEELDDIKAILNIYLEKVKETDEKVYLIIDE